MFVLCVCAWGCSPEEVSSVVTSKQHQEAGYIEEVVLFPGGHRIKAKLDTGAYTASLDARDISTFEKEGKEWVRFSYVTNDSEVIVFEAEKVEESSIKTHSDVKSLRPVVLLNIEVAGKRYPARVNLINRANFLYPLLLGREFMSDANIVVNPAETYRLSENTLPNKKTKTK